MNLFDIVRLHETTNNNKQNKPDRITVIEAQLIGRGARYYPFKLPNKPVHYTRQFDAETNHKLRICETFLYHSSYNSKYIKELQTALVEIGITADKATAEPMYKQKRALQNSSRKKLLI